MLSLNYSKRNLVRTKSCGLEGCPAINNTAIPCNNCLVDAISDHHQVLLFLINGHVFLVNTCSDVDEEVPRCRGRFVGRRRNGVVQGGEVSAAIFADSDDVRHLHLVTHIRLKELSPTDGLVDGARSGGHLER